MENLTSNDLNRAVLYNNLLRTEICLFNSNDSRIQYQHNVVKFELNLTHNGDDESEIDTANLVLSMCQIRNEMTLKKTNLKVLVTDLRGGVGASAVFVSMYEIMQLVDNAITQDNRIKNSADCIDVFAIANRLRKDRANMFEDFSIYKVVYQCLGYYGLNRETIRKHLFTTKSGKYDEDGEENGPALKLEAKFRSSNNDSQLRENIHFDEMAEYVLDEPESNDEDICVEYYDDRVKNHHNYTNIDEMSEYV